MDYPFRTPITMSKNSNHTSGTKDALGDIAVPVAASPKHQT